MLLEPRRVAARAAAERMAEMVGERVGDRVGLRTRFDTRTSDRTRIEVVTEGVLTRMLLDDPGLTGVGIVIFDEFHERSIHADLGLALTTETRGVLRPDLRLLLMSATIDTDRLSARLEVGTVVRSDGRAHPVVTEYRPPVPGRGVEDEAEAAAGDAVAADRGDVLVFLPGAAAINRVARRLERALPSDVVVAALHGSLPHGDQDTALRPDPEGRRKVILATSIAETSVTIDGVRIVIDSGLTRRPFLDVDRGFSGLRTVRNSRASADQRRGRAGRQEPGRCIRLWPEADQQHRAAEDPPEITVSDLSGLALDLAAWGVEQADDLTWIDPPPPVALARARATLGDLGALDDELRLTDHGRAMAGLAAPPPLAHLMITAAGLGWGPAACDLAAILAVTCCAAGTGPPTYGCASKRSRARPSKESTVPSSIGHAARLGAGDGSSRWATTPPTRIWPGCSCRSRTRTGWPSVGPGATVASCWPTAPARRSAPTIPSPGNPCWRWRPSRAWRTTSGSSRPRPSTT
ncbi:MAG: helicase-related protein, partial [Acidimicrobiales bacterium]